MTSRPEGRSTLFTALLVAAALAFGIVLAQFLPTDLLGLRRDHAGHDHAQTVAGDAAEGGLWTCGMHPHVIEEEPGQCPICGMDLTPMRGSGNTQAGHEHGKPGGGDDGGGEILFYRNPMDPTITSPVPAKDSSGMDYVPVYAGGPDAGPEVRIDPAVVQNMNVRTEVASRRDLTQPIRAVGYLEFDQQRMVTVTTKYSGWVEKVYVNYVGEKVRPGQALFEIYSPELVQTEQELLSALAFAREMRDAPEDARHRALSMVDSARVRLGYWDISPRQIAQLEETSEVFRTLRVTAPAGGLVMKRMAGLEGMAVEPGMELFHIADLSSLWLSVELFEDQLAWVREGTAAEIELSYFPGESFRGRVRFLEPELSETSRTLRAKIEVPNPDGRLRKGMFATVDLQPVRVEGALAVPSQAVIRTGRRSVVVLASGEGRFAPREVAMGHEAEGFVEILSGLEEGDRVVTSAQFLLDSESKLREAIQKMIASRGVPAASQGRAGEAGADRAPAGSGAPADHTGYGEHGQGG